MKKISFTLLLILLGFYVSAQKNIKLANKFFQSAEDYYAGKPVSGITLSNLKNCSIEVDQNGEKDKIKAAKLPHQWFCNSEGMLMRIFEGDLYYVLLHGPICFYLKCKQAEQVWLDKDGYYSYSLYLSDTYPSDFYSETINGEIKKLKGKNLEKKLEEKGLLKQYEDDKNYKRERSDNVISYKIKMMNKRIKYLKLLNEKSK